MVLFILFFIVFFMVAVLFLIGFFFKIFFCDSFFNYNGVCSFESGFSSVGLVQNSFSIHFFMILLMFVIFDLEIVMLIGVVVSDFSSIYSFVFIILFVLLGFYMEWWYGKLVWSL